MQRGDGLYSVGAADCPGASFREAEVLHFSCGDEVLDGTGDIFDGDVGVDAVLVEQVDRINVQALEGGIADFFDVLRAAVEWGGARRQTGLAVEAEFGGDLYLVADWREGFANEDFVGERSIDFGGVEDRDTEVDGFVHEGDHLVFVVDYPGGEAHAHAAETECGNFEVGA